MRRYSAPGELAKSYGASQGFVDTVRGFTVVGSLKGAWSGYKTIKSMDLTAGTKVGSLTTLFDVTGSGGMVKGAIQLEKAASVIGLGMFVLEGAYTLGSAAGAVGDVIGEHGNDCK